MKWHSPCHERAVQTFKQAMKRSTSPLDIRLSNILFAYCLTPHATTGRTPAEMLLKRQPKSVLDLLRPDTEQRVRRNQERQKVNHDQGSRLRTFRVGDPVLARNFGKDPAKWFRGHVSQCRGPLSYEITLEDGRQIRRHVDYLQPGASNDNMDDIPAPDIASPPNPSVNSTPESICTPPDSPVYGLNPELPITPPVQTPPLPHQSTHNRCPPD